ncbi:MAG: hypothetical protein IJW14_01125 [Oscillospiraceae bacterium]|nr:hypothetical protein [Oscillospiraceae bacterium]
MNRRTDLITGLLSAAGLAFLIFDSKTALLGAADGINLCIRTLVPTLFPFFFLSNMLSSVFMGQRLSILRPLGRLCRIPEGAEYILLSGLLGGYPVGAQCICNAMESGSLSRKDARRMLAFCNNCGPAFVFGVCGALYDEVWVPWALMVIHIISALIVAFVIPGNGGRCMAVKNHRVSPVRSLNQALRSMAMVCGWVILFKVLLAFLNRWIMWYFPAEVQIAFTGFLELSNGCLGLGAIDNTRLRFILCATFLGFGGFCVAIQSYFAAGNVDTGLYFPGKLLQCAISATLACVLCTTTYFVIPCVFSILFGILLRKSEKRCRNPQIVVV